MELFRTHIDSPIGRVRVLGTERGITHVDFADAELPHAIETVPPAFRMCVEQLEQYFAGVRQSFDTLPLVLRGTEFQLKVWDAASDVPYGETVHYGDIAKAIGHPDAVRAVGTALGRNSLCLIVPCHRILPKSSGVGEYAWGSERKEWLLAHEMAKSASK